MFRAAYELVQAHGDVNQGASTITQQLARNAYDLKGRARDRGEGSFGRKIVELFLAKRITDRYSKDQVLEFYLNRVYLGRGYYGIRAASLGYFGKEPADLTTREAASIAALIKNPNNLAPTTHPKANLKWRNHVLSRMAKEGYITWSEAQRLQEMPLATNPKPLTRGVSHIYERIATQITQYLGEDRVNAAGLKIYTTLDKDLQDATGAALKSSLDAIEKRPDFKHPKLSSYVPGSSTPKYLDGAVLVVDNATGAILAYHGGRDYTKRQYDAIELGARPPGTSLLPVLYATAFESGYSPASKVLDDAIDNRLTGIGGVEGILGEWGMEEQKNRYEGNVTMREALCKSKIAASLRLGMEIGPKPFVRKMEDFGIRKPVRESGTEVNPVYRPRIYVGTEPASLKEMTIAFTAIPNGGERPDNLYFLDRVEDETGYVIWESPQALGNRKRVRAMDSATAFQLHSILADSLARGSAQRVRSFLPNQFQGGVKTGTTYDFGDNWLFGYDSRITCGVWIGFLDGHKAIYDGAFSSDTCGSILGKTFASALRDFPAQSLVPPNTVENVPICTVSGKRATRNCYELDPRATGSSPKYRSTTIPEYLRKGDMTLPLCDVHGEESVSLEMFASSTGPNNRRILPVIPILARQPALLGKDPYHTEQVVAPNKQNYDLLATPAENAPAPAAEVDDEDDLYDSTEATILLPTPAPINMKEPRGSL
jgi:penicillin-binding protein 1A